MQLRPSLPAINWAHPLAQGLVWNATPGVQSRRELTRKGGGALLTSGSWGGKTLSGDSLSSTSTVNGGSYYPWNTALETITNKVTVIAWAKPDALVNFSHLWCVPYHNGWSSPFASLTFCAFDSAGKMNLQFAVGGSLFNNSTSSNYIIPGDPLTMYAASYDGATIRYFVNGIFKEAVTPSNTGNIDFGDRVEAVIANRSSASTDEGFQGQIPFIGVWNRNLSDRDMLNIYENPWLLYKRLPRQVVSTVSAPLFSPKYMTWRAPWAS